MPTVQPISTAGFQSEFLSPVVKEAVKTARKRQILSKPEFYSLDFDNKLTSWTVSGDLTNKSILGIQRAANDAIAAGQTYKDFTSMVTPQVVDAMVAPKVVWRNAINFVYQKGRFDQQGAIKALRPFLKYVTFGDDKVRPNHRILNGKVAAFDDVFWAKNYPPNGHNCRCTARSLTPRQVDKLGLKVQTDEEITREVVSTQLEAGTPQADVVYPIADKGWVGSFKTLPSGADQQIKAFGKMPVNFFTFLTPSPPVIETATAAEVVQSQTIINATAEKRFEDFTKIGEQKGGNEGAQFVYKDGQKYYIKYLDEEHATNELLANKLYNLAGVDVPELDLIRKDGKRTLASKWRENKEIKTYLQNGKVAGVPEGFGADVWLANWDWAGASFDNIVLDAKTGAAFRIDAGGSLKFRALGGVKGPAFNANVDELLTYFNESKNIQSATVLKNYTLEELLPSVEKIGKVKIADIKKLVNAFGLGTTEEKKALVDLLVARRDKMVAWAKDARAGLKETEKLIKDAAKAKTAAKKVAKEAKVVAQKETIVVDREKKTALKKADKAATAEEEALKKSNFEKLSASNEDVKNFERGAKKVTPADVQKIKDSRGVGYSVPSDDGAIYDQQIKYFESLTKDNERALNATFNIRGKEFEKIKALVNLPEIIKGYGTPDLDSAFLRAIRKFKGFSEKTLPFNPNDLETARALYRAARDQKAELEIGLNKLVNAGSYTKALEKEALDHYQVWMDEIYRSLKEVEIQIGKGLPTKMTWTKEGVFEGFKLPDPIQPEAPVKAKMNFQRQQNVVYESNIRNGDINETEKEVWKYGNYWRANYKGAEIKIFTDEGDFALMGRVQIKVKGGAKEAKKIIDIIEDLGIDMTAPKYADAEELYLRQIYGKVAPEQIAMEAKQVDKLKTVEEKIELWKAKINGKAKSAGIPNFKIDLEPDYNFVGEREKFGNGALIRKTPKRLEGAGENFDRFRGSHSLIHQPYSTIVDERGIEVPKARRWDLVTDRILSSGGQYYSTVEKIERGIFPNGWSPEPDLQKGGGHYCFTRIRETHKAGRTVGFVWDADRIRRVDAISYAGDSHGKTSGTFIADNRKFGTVNYKNISSGIGNETNFKGAFNFFDGLKNVFVEDEAQRKATIAVFKKHKYFKLPDGRAIEDVVKIAGNSFVDDTAYFKANGIEL